MAKLNAAARKALPKKDFAAPATRSKSGGKGGFPINDKTHAEKALQMAPRSEHAGNISHAQVENIRAKVHKKFPEIGKHSGFNRMK